MCVCVCVCERACVCVCVCVCACVHMCIEGIYTCVQFPYLLEAHGAHACMASPTPNYTHTHTHVQCRLGFDCVVKTLRFRILKANCVFNNCIIVYTYCVLILRMLHKE